MPAARLGNSPLSLEILSRADDVVGFVDQARRSADSESNALGFLPEGAYLDAALQGKLLVATVEEGGQRVYVGHLLYGCVYPHARIVQVFALPAFRRRGVGRQLVEYLVRDLERMQFMSVVARVATDLSANHFWETLSFGTVVTKPGGRTTGRTINVRVRELDCPRLFPVRAAPGMLAETNLSLGPSLFLTAPVYVLDLNVLFDLVRKRTNAEDVGRAIAAGFSGLVSLRITEEFVDELRRTSIPAPTDPILELALRLPRLQSPSPERRAGLATQLREVVFPCEFFGGSLRPQDQSDLIHLSIAISCGASGFVTSEKAILRASEKLRSKYSLHVVGTREFADSVEPSDSVEITEVHALSEEGRLQGRVFEEEDRGPVLQFLRKLQCPPPIPEDAVRSDSARPRRRMVVVHYAGVLAFASWEIPSAIHPRVRAFICVDEGHFAANHAADFLLDAIGRESFGGYPVQIDLRLLPGHAVTRRVGMAHGFRPPVNEASTGNTLHKIAVGRCLTPGNWVSICRQLRERMSVELPSDVPTFKSMNQAVSVGRPPNAVVELPLGELESLLSPAIFCVPERLGALVPIRRVYAADLLGCGEQLSLLESPEAVLLRERIYFSDPRTARVLTAGRPIIFYESGVNGGAAAAVAVARVVGGQLVAKVDVADDLLRKSVLDKDTLAKINLADSSLATTIDNIMSFKKRVGLDRLRALNAVDGSNLVTARPLSAEQVAAIVEEGGV